MRALVPCLSFLLLASCGAAPERPSFPARPRRTASSEFWARWGDGLAELSTYRGTVSRYGEPRPAEQVLVYVTEPLDRDTLIKDDDAPRDRRVQVLKLNSMLRFQTGIYPYGVMTSVFAPVDAYYAERFAPAKITMSAQEWCGHVFAGVWPGQGTFFARGLSYFASEGERDELVHVGEGALYEDALPIQLRELDGDFAGGGDWSGMLVPSLWRARRDHTALAPVRATITRSREADVTRFTLRAGDYERVFEVEATGAKRILGWTTNQGESMRVVATDRMPYWELNQVGEESARERIGLPRDLLTP
ncbi:hypothetical protein [Sandaracinus amylolyticus]|uniref:hypothetical protein n=1 Tax=Sandaracinus amylolyticus TaxID=927083 RepID=UPI001F41D946|nr:hypothetical protein [Sandaracinus amylolyticus]UJR78643.1 Hypothetical protein I5071_6740 [Sandaracinus amylolyticus]